MVNRPAGGARSKKWERAPYDWYREGPRPVEQLLNAINFGDDLIWDCCCGAGNILDVARRWGHQTVGSDIVDRNPRHRFIRGNILTHISKAPTLPGRATSLICNPPYSYEPDIAEKIITHVLERFAIRKAAFILPIAFLASQDRWAKNRLGRWKPSQVCIYRERHTMPPGMLIEQMAKPYEGGMADYCVVVYSTPHRFRTELIWLEPGHHEPRQKSRGQPEGKPE